MDLFIDHCVWSHFLLFFFISFRTHFLLFLRSLTSGILAQLYYQAKPNNPTQLTGPLCNAFHFRGPDGEPTRSNGPESSDLTIKLQPCAPRKTLPAHPPPLQLRRRLHLGRIPHSSPPPPSSSEPCKMVRSDCLLFRLSEIRICSSFRSQRPRSDYAIDSLRRCSRTTSTCSTPRRSSRSSSTRRSASSSPPILSSWYVFLSLICSRLW
jgi:hypothetical protein